MSEQWQANEELISEMIKKVEQKKIDETLRHDAKVREITEKLCHLSAMRERARQGLPVYLNVKKV